MAVSTGSLERISTDCAYIDELVSLIPPHLYFPPDEERVQSRYLKHSKKELPTLSELKAKRAETKRARLDPTQNAKSVVEIQRENKERQKREREEAAAEEEEEEEEDGEEEDEEDEDEDDDDDDDDDAGDAGDELSAKERFAAKMAELRAARHADGPAAEAKALAKRENRQEDKARKKAQAESAAEKAAKRKAKQRKAAERQESELRKARGRTAAAERAANGEPDPLPKPRAPRPAAAAPPVDATSAPSVAEIEYATLKLPATRALADTREFTDPAKARGPSAKMLLAKAKADKAKLAAAEQDARAHADRAGESAWAKALQKAQGGKVLDDERLLKKTVKRNDAQKRKSAAAWAERVSAVEKAKAERQQARKANLAKRDRMRQGLQPKEPVTKPAGGAAAGASAEQEKHTRKERKEFATKLGKQKEAAEAVKEKKGKGGGKSGKAAGSASKRPRTA